MPAPGSGRRYFTPRGKALEWITRVHRGLYQLTGGVLGATVFQRAEPGDRWPLRPIRILLLTTTGRKSGLERTTPLPYFTYQGRVLVVASFAGGARDPAWCHNLRANPEVQVQIGRRRAAGRARELTGAGRDRYWTLLVRDWPRYGLYQQQTARTIPLIELRLGPSIST